MDKRLVLPIVLLSALLVVQAQIWLGRGSVHSVEQMREQLGELRSSNAQLHATNDRLTAEVRDLQEGLEMVEEKARAELGMLKRNEIFIQTRQ